MYPPHVCRIPFGLPVEPLKHKQEHLPASAIGHDTLTMNRIYRQCNADWTASLGQCDMNNTL